MDGLTGEGGQVDGGGEISVELGAAVFTGERPLDEAEFGFHRTTRRAGLGAGIPPVGDEGRARRAAVVLYAIWRRNSAIPSPAMCRARCVPRARLEVRGLGSLRRGAVLEMEVGPPGSSYRGWFQTTACSCVVAWRVCPVYRWRELDPGFARNVSRSSGGAAPVMGWSEGEGSSGFS